MAAIKTVGVKDLKNRLSEYLREVRGGAVVLVTDRGTVVAELREPSMHRQPGRDYSLLEEWSADGSVHLPLGRRTSPPVSQVILPDGTARRLLDLDRSE